MVNVALRLLCHRKGPRCPIIKGWVGHKAKLHVFERDKISCHNRYIYFLPEFLLFFSLCIFSVLDFLSGLSWLVPSLYCKHTTQTSIRLAGFKSVIPASDRLQTHWNRHRTLVCLVRSLIAIPTSLPQTPFLIKFLIYIFFQSGIYNSL